MFLSNSAAICHVLSRLNRSQNSYLDYFTLHNYTYQELIWLLLDWMESRCLKKKELFSSSVVSNILEEKRASNQKFS